MNARHLILQIAVPVTTYDPDEDKNIALQLQQQYDEDFAHTQNSQNQGIHFLSKYNHLLLNLYSFPFTFKFEVPMTTHDPDEDRNIALQLQEQYDEDFADTPNSQNQGILFVKI